MTVLLKGPGELKTFTTAVCGLLSPCCRREFATPADTASGRLIRPGSYGESNDSLETRSRARGFPQLNMS